MLCWEANETASTINLLCSPKLVWFWTQLQVGDIWAHWQHGAEALGRLDVWTSHPLYYDVGELDGVSMNFKCIILQPNCKGGRNKVLKHRYPVPDTLRLSKTFQRERQIEVMTSRRHMMQSSWWSCCVPWDISDVSEHLCFHLNSTPGPADCNPAVAHTSVWLGQTGGTPETQDWWGLPSRSLCQRR